jgi:hypothetical protein
MKKRLIALLFGILLVAGSAGAQVVIRPGPRYVWTLGYYRYDGRRYVWVPGRYVLPPRPHARWVPGHWAHRRGGYVWIEGHWR